jgi:Gpi18-like mannosyltransferase
VKKLLILAIVLRVLVAAFFFHPDIKTFNYQASFLKQGVFNIYSYLVDNKARLPLKDNFVYFPLTYFTLGGYQAAISPILGRGFDSWLGNPDSATMVTNPNIFGYMLALKLPYLVLDILVAYMLLKFIEDRKKAQKAFLIWLFNPITIILIYVYGNIDIFPVVLTVFSLLLIKKDKLKSAVAILGLAAGFKLYPLLLVPFLALAGKNTKEKIWLVAIPFLIFGAICVPFLSGAFVQSALISGLTTGTFSPSFSVGFGESIIVGLVGMTVLFFYEMLINKKPNVLIYWIALLMIIFSFSHFHIQWLLWVAPFITIILAEDSDLTLLISSVSVMAVAIPLLYEDRFMTMGLLRTFSLYYDMLPTPFVVIQRVFDPYNLQSILHSMMAGGTLVMIYRLFKVKS